MSENNPSPPMIEREPTPTRESVMAQVADIQTATFGQRLVVAVITMKNGFLVTGESFCANAETFKEERGQEIAVHRATEKAWEFELYAHHERAMRRYALLNFKPLGMPS